MTIIYDFPNSPSTKDEYIAPNGRIYFFEGNNWTAKPSLLSPNPVTTKLFRYRSIYTRGYVTGGYKNSSPWRNVNRTEHSTDITTNLGDKMTYANSYKSGSHSDYNHYVYGSSNSHAASEDYVSAFNMSNETEISHSTARDMKVNRKDATAFINPIRTTTYITGGGSTSTDKHNMVTDIMYSAGHAPNNPIGTGSAGSESQTAIASFYGEYKAWLSDNSGASFTWATETYSSGGISWSTDGQPKGLSSKHGYGYGAVGTYTGSSTLYKFNDTNGGSSVSSFTRAKGTQGEENWQIGQNWGYMLGGYNGVQNNNSERISYLTDTSTALGSDSEPKGHDGMSSAACGSASAMYVGIVS